MNNEDLSGIFEKLGGSIDKDKISPEMVNNLLNMLGSSSGSTNSTDNNSANPSSQSNSSQPDFNNTSDTSSSTNSIDPETLLKMKSIIEQMNSSNNDPRSNLLESLKPYLKESRKSKLDQYIQFMNMSKMMNFLPFMSGDKNKDG